MKFYVLKRPRVGQSPFDTEFLDQDPVHVGQAPVCPLCGEYVGMLPWLPPHRAELEALGQDFGDIAFGPGLEFLVSEQFKEPWCKTELVGLEGFFPVEIAKVKKHKKIGGSVPNYFCVSVVRSRAAIDVVASGLERNDGTGAEVCPECRLGPGVRRAQRIVLEPSTWSGEDIFIARGLPGTYIASERFKGFCERNQMKNAVLIPALEYSFDFYPWEKSNKSESG